MYEKGSLYSPKVLEITDDDLASAVSTGIQQIAAAALALHVPTIVATPHLLIEGYKNVLAVAIETENPFPQAQKVFDYLKDPSAFAVAAAPAAAAGGAAPAAAAAAAPEPEEEEDEDLGFSLFD